MKDSPTERCEEGLAWLRERDPDAVTILEELRAGSSDLVDHLLAVLYGKIFSRSRLNEHTKCLLAVACAAAGGFAPQLRYQTRLALLSGLTIDELYEVCFFVGAFNGLSHAMNAMNLMRSVHEEMSGPTTDERSQPG